MWDRDVECIWDFVLIASYRAAAGTKDKSDPANMKKPRWFVVDRLLQIYDTPSDV